MVSNLSPDLHIESSDIYNVALGYLCLRRHRLNLPTLNAHIGGRRKVLVTRVTLVWQGLGCATCAHVARVLTGKT